MKRRGVNYDVGSHPFGASVPSRPDFDPAVVRREISIIKNDLHCNAIRITGRDPKRLVLAAETALAEDLEVWFGPACHNAGEEETLTYLAECAKAAETLRRTSPHVVFLAGWELTLFMKGLVSGDTGMERIAVLKKPWRQLWSTLRRGHYNTNLNRFLHHAAQQVRRHFNGPVSYAAGSWEEVDWTPFDYVGIDCYRDAGNRGHFRRQVRKYHEHGKPVVMTEFGCCTYQGVADKGAFGWAIVDWSAEPPKLNGDYTRDEHGQARYLTELLDVFTGEQVDGAFAFTFVTPTYPHSSEPRYDLDMASYALVKTYAHRHGSTYPDLPWEPKPAFHSLAAYYADAAAAGRSMGLCSLPGK